MKQSLTGLVFLIGFSAITAHDVLTKQVAQAVEQYLLPADPAKVLQLQSTIVDERLVEELGARSLVVDNQSMSLVSQDGKTEFAPDGYYKFSNGLIVTIENGQVLNRFVSPSHPASPSQPVPENLISPNWSEWAEWPQGDTRWWRQSSPLPFDILPFQNPNQKMARVQDVFNKVCGTENQTQS